MPRFLMALALVLSPAMAPAASIQTVLSGAELRGAARFRLVGIPLYDARLYTPGGAALDWRKDFALELTYLRRLSQDDLIDATMRELDRTGGRVPIRAQLARCYEDVSQGDRYLAVSRGQNRLSFWLNGKPTCTLAYPGIKARFMAIFLGDNSRSASFTRRLKGD